MQKIYTEIANCKLTLKIIFVD